VISKRAGKAASRADERAVRIGETFREAMDDNLAVRRAIEGVSREAEAAAAAGLVPEVAAAVTAAFKEIDGVLGVIF